MGTRRAARCALGIFGTLVVCAAVVACDGESEPLAATTPQAAPATTTTTTVTTTTTPRLPPDTDLSVVCDGETFLDGALYDGPPPHPTQAFGFGTLYGEYDVWPAPWRNWKPDTFDAGRVQLVLCEEDGKPRRTGKVCHYQPQYSDSGSPRSLTLELAVAELTLTEVVTGNVVAHVRVTAKSRCPEFTTTRPDENTVTSFTEVADYARALRTYVLG